jgi:RimJ/RimL family protein N-acetyltransferase
MSRFYLASWDGMVAHISWIFDSEHPSPLVRLKSGEAEVAYSHTLPPFRGRHIFSSVLSVILDDLARQGYSRIYAHVLPDNTPSIRAFTSAGFQPIGKVIWQHILGIRRVVDVSGARCGGLHIPRT